MDTLNNFLQEIYFATPIRSLNTEQMVYLQTYVETFRTIADALGIEIIDWFKESGIIQYPAASASGESIFTHSNPWFNEGDLIHPSQLGVNAMAKLAVSKMISSFCTEYVVVIVRIRYRAKERIRYICIKMVF